MEEEVKTPLELFTEKYCPKNGIKQFLLDLTDVVLYLTWRK